MKPRDLALRKEDDGMGYYRRCGAAAGIPELSRIFDLLSQDEARHADALHALGSGARVTLPPSPTLEGARPILRRLSLAEAPLSHFAGDLRAYLVAMDFESNSAGVCERLAAEALCEWEREMLLTIAAEDEIHFTLLEHVCELLEPAAGGGRDGGIDAD